MESDSFFEEYRAIINRTKRKFLRRKVADATIGGELVSLAARLAAGVAELPHYGGVCHAAAAGHYWHHQWPVLAWAQQLQAAKCFLQADSLMSSSGCSLNVNQCLQNAITTLHQFTQQPQQQEEEQQQSRHPPPPPSTSSCCQLFAAGAQLQLSQVYQRHELPQLAVECVLEAAQLVPFINSLALRLEAVDLSVHVGDLFKAEQILKNLGKEFDSVKQCEGRATIAEHKTRWRVTYLLLLLVTLPLSSPVTDVDHQKLLRYFLIDTDFSQLLSTATLFDEMDESLFVCLNSVVRGAVQHQSRVLRQLAHVLDGRLNLCQRGLLNQIIDQAEERELPTEPPPTAVV